MFNKIIYMFAFYTITFLWVIVEAYNIDNMDIITDYKFIPKKGFVIDINENVDLTDVLKEIDDNKSEDEKKKLEYFKTTKIKTPEIWKKKWIENKNNKDEVLKKEGQLLSKKYEKEIIVPDPNDNYTVFQLIAMSRNAYVQVDVDDWIDLTDYGWDEIMPFGWDGDSNGKNANQIRGYIFINERIKTAVISIKGTSAGLFGIGGPTAENDKYNDNMMFSCCCAIVDRTWKGICGCHSGISNTCELTCLKDISQTYENNYYNQLSSVLNDARKFYRNNGYEVYVTGHSLGGALASLSGLSLMAPAFTYEAPGEAQFADRIGIKPKDKDGNDIPNKDIPIYHFGNDGDPIYLGKCTGITSACYYSGFAMETKCHVGKMYMFELDKNISIPDDNDPQNDRSRKNKSLDDKTSNNNSSANSYNYLEDEEDEELEKSKSPKNRVFLNNKSSIYEHQLYIKSSGLEKRNDMDPSKTPSNPSKLNMLHHRVDYVIGLITKWQGEWPKESYQDGCRDCRNWNFISREGHEDSTDSPK